MIACLEVMEVPLSGGGSPSRCFLARGPMARPAQPHVSVLGTLETLLWSARHPSEYRSGGAASASGECVKHASGASNTKEELPRTCGASGEPRYLLRPETEEGESSASEEEAPLSPQPSALGAETIGLAGFGIVSS